MKRRLPKKTRNSARVNAGRRAGPIGDEAERVFEKWGAVGGFTVAKLDPDRQGLDRFFEFPPDPLRPGFGLDARSPPVRAFVQIKGTQHAPGAGVALNLAIMERLVQLDMPCFVLGIELDAKFDAVSARLAHIDEDEIGRVLKELRLLDTNDQELLHQTTYTLRWTKHDVIDPTAFAFLDRAKRDVGDPKTYAARKKGWWTRVGYEPMPRRLSLRLQATTAQVAQAVMGDAELDATVLSHTEVRFGIELPVVGGPSGQVRIAFGPPVGTKAILRVRRSGGVAVVQGELQVVRAPKELAEECPIRFAAPGLVLDLPRRVSDQATVSFLPLASDARLPLRESASAARAFGGIVKELAPIELLVDDKAHELRLADVSLGPGEHGLLNRVAAFEWAAHVAHEVGIPDDTIVTRADVDSQIRALCLWAVYGGVANTEELTLLYKTTPTLPTERPLILTVTAALRLGDWIAVKLLAFRDPSPTVRSGGVVAIRPRPLAGSSAHAVTRKEAPALDLIAIADAFEAEIKGKHDGANAVVVEDHDHLKKIWNDILDARSSSLAK